ncbi:MAG: HlyD family efflux transporter periplasmic adaptor subunit [Planctomycetota bacterium]|nr:MAG: HlyD family efflux transporter periplasmic adaptor subunit [Planctomycetota bacterium]REK25560.1 MAG: HlyD family efflux transporter periplasmic adaptor subunit [Planctomycetota bacterium]REK31728.1 MAG: HlyD family efflux transporter periplasmic adaptor subunit [Planctomycetota bacterium]
MSTSSQIDLKDLAIRGERDGRPSLAPKRRIISRVVLPGLLIIGFVSVLAWAARDTWLPRTPVTVVPVRVSLSELQSGGTPLFNAAGWVEPRPTPIRVAALASGVVEELLVVEDQFVEQGEPIARLVDEDAILALEQAKAVYRLREAEVKEAQAAVTAAQVNFDIPAHLELPVAEAEAALAAIETELSNLPHQQKRAEARLRLAEYDLETKKNLGDATTRLSVQEAQSERDAAIAEVAELTKRQPALINQKKALSRLVDAAATRLELKTDEQQALDAAQARLLAAQSRLDQAKVAVDEAELRLSRMTVYAPVDGRILDLTTQPGSHVMGSTGAMQGEDRSTVVKLYDPQALQVRVDVRFEDLPQTGGSQPVEVRSPAVSAPLKGEVLFLTGFANIQKNTLEVKVSIDDPPAVLKPDMLVDVTFLAPETEAADDQPSEQFRLFVPQSLVQREGDAAFVWVADVAEQVARRRRVTVGKNQNSDFVEVTDGLTAASRLIASGRELLEEGDRILITGEEAARGGDVAEPASPSRFPESPGQ